MGGGGVGRCAVWVFTPFSQVHTRDYTESKIPGKHVDAPPLSGARCICGARRRRLRPRPLAWQTVGPSHTAGTSTSGNTAPLAATTLAVAVAATDASTIAGTVAAATAVAGVATADATINATAFTAFTRTIDAASTASHASPTKPAWPWIPQVARRVWLLGEPIPAAVAPFGAAASQPAPAVAIAPSDGAARSSRRAAAAASARQSRAGLMGTLLLAACIRRGAGLVGSPAGGLLRV